MNDNAYGLVTGILIQSEIERRNNEVLREQQSQNNELNEEKSKLHEQNEIAKKKNNILAEDNEDLLDDVQTLNIINRDLLEKNIGLYNKALDLQAEVDEYKLLLCKPMAEIASKHGNFQETYEQQMELIVNWMVSQKAFKEIAIQFGLEKGLTADEVIEIGHEKRLAVLDNQNNPEHKTNASDVPAIVARIPKLKRQVKGKVG